MAEVYAGFCSYTDHEIGRLIDYLEKTGQLDNTLIVVISDNGASGEGGPNGSVNENKFFNSVPDDMEENLKMLDELGSRGNVQPLSHRLGDGVQHAVQAVQALLVGRRHLRPDDRALAQGHQGQGRGARPVHALQRHRADGVRLPGHRTAGRRSRATPSGRWKARASSTASTTPRRRRRSEPVLRHARHARHLARRAGRRTPIHRRRPSDWSHFTEDEWELYNTEVDRSECHDLADQEPVKLRGAEDLWYVEAGQVLWPAAGRPRRRSRC